MNPARKLPLARPGAEGFVIVLGVMIALAADRWVTGIDDRALETSYLARLIEGITDDSVEIAGMIEQAEERSALAVQVLGGMPSAEVTRPAEFLARLERISWYAPADYSREAWDELLATGNLFLIHDQDIRRALSEYYNRIEWLSQLESNWRADLLDYFNRAQDVLPPLIRLEVLDLRPPGSDAITVGDEEVRDALSGLGENSDRVAELSTLAVIYSVQADVYGTLLEQHIREVLHLLRNAP